MEDRRKHSNPSSKSSGCDLIPPTKDQFRLRIHDDLVIDLIRIPAGAFLMNQSEKDPHKPGALFFPDSVYLDEFWIGKYPVTRFQYSGFLAYSGYVWPVAGEDWDIPATAVSYEEAAEFCTWATIKSGLKVLLPDEAQWEKAARGNDGRIYPWGNEPLKEDRCNYANQVGKATHVGTYSPGGDSPYGCADMLGNVWEWCSRNSAMYDAKGSPGRNEDCVLRGGCWETDGSIICASRIEADSRLKSPCFGFRVCIGKLV